MDVQELKNPSSSQMEQGSDTTSLGCFSPLRDFPDLLLGCFVADLGAEDYASLEVASKALCVSSSLIIGEEHLSLPEVAALYNCSIASSFFRSSPPNDRSALRLRCGGSWKLVLRFLRALQQGGRFGQAQVAAGPSFSIAVTSGGAIWTWGSGSKGVLGLGPRVEVSEWVPRRVASLASVRVASCAAGYNHSLLATECGQVWAFGRDEYGCCGLGSSCWQTVDQPQLIGALSGTRIVQVAAGRMFSGALSWDGQLFTFGQGANCGHGSLSHEFLPRKVMFPGSSNSNDSSQSPAIVQIRSGPDYLLALALRGGAGELYSFGKGWSGVLGHGTQANELLPRLVRALLPAAEQGSCGPDPVAVAAGSAHALALSRDGRVFSWGLGCGGCLGNGSTAPRKLPEVVAGLAGHGPIVGVEAGLHSSFILQKDGKVFSFGWGGCRGLGLPTGEVGVEEPGQQAVVALCPLPQLEPRQVTALQHEEVCQLAAPSFMQGEYESKHMLALTKSGKVFSFGYGHFGQLGVGYINPSAWFPCGSRVESLQMNK